MPPPRCLIAHPDEIFPIPDTKKNSIVLCHLLTVTATGEALDPVPKMAPRGGGGHVEG